MHNKQKLNIDAEELPAAHSVLEVTIAPGAPRIYIRTDGIGNPWITHQTNEATAPSVSLPLRGLRAILCESRSEYISISTNVIDLSLWWAASSGNLIAYVPKHAYASRFFFPVQPMSADLDLVPLWLSPGKWRFIYEEWVGTPTFKTYSVPDFYPPLTVLAKPALSQSAIAEWNDVFRRQTSFAYFGHELGLT